MPDKTADALARILSLCSNDETSAAPAPAAATEHLAAAPGPQDLEREHGDHRHDNYRHDNNYRHDLLSTMFFEVHDDGHETTGRGRYNLGWAAEAEYTDRVLESNDAAPAERVEDVTPWYHAHGQSARCLDHYGAHFNGPEDKEVLGPSSGESPVASPATCKTTWLG